MLSKNGNFLIPREKEFVTVFDPSLISRAHWLLNRSSSTQGYSLMTSRRNKSDPALGSQFPAQLIWPEPPLATRLEWSFDVEKWQDLHQQVISQEQHSPGLGQLQVPSREKLQRTSSNVLVPQRGTWSCHGVTYRVKSPSPGPCAGASGVQISPVLTSLRSTFIRENTWQVTACAFLWWSYI